jgi:hypothetical protein
MSMEMMREQYYVLDYIGDFNDIGMPNYTVLERIQQYELQFINTYDGLIVHSGDYEDIFPTFDEYYWLLVHVEMLNEEDMAYLDPYSYRFGYVDTAVQIVYHVTVQDIDYTEISEFEIEITLMPRTTSYVDEIVWMESSTMVQFEGVVTHIDNNYMVVKDDTGYLMVSLNVHQYDLLYQEGIVSIGDHVVGIGSVYGFNIHGAYNYINDLAAFHFVQAGEPISEVHSVVTFNDLYNFDYMDRTHFLTPIIITGQLYYDGNFYIYDSVNDPNGLYPLMLHHYDQSLFDHVGEVITVKGYLLGIRTTASRFGWFVYNTDFFLEV